MSSFRSNPNQEFDACQAFREAMGRDQDLDELEQCDEPDYDEFIDDREKYPDLHTIQSLPKCDNFGSNEDANELSQVTVKMGQSQSSQSSIKSQNSRQIPQSQQHNPSIAEFETAIIGFNQTFQSMVNQCYTKCIEYFQKKKTNPTIKVVLNPYSNSNIEVSSKYRSKDVSLYKLQCFVSADKLDPYQIRWG